MRHGPTSQGQDCFDVRAAVANEAEAMARVMRLKGQLIEAQKNADDDTQIRAELARAQSDLIDATRARATGQQ